MIAPLPPLRLLLVPLLAMAMVPASTEAQGTPIDWSATAARSRGDSARFALTARLAPGWHVYALSQSPGGPVALRIEAMAPATIVGPVTAPTPILALDRSFGIMTETHEGEATFRGTAVAPPASPLSLRVRYQVCDDRVCLPPTTADVPVAVSGVAAVGRVPASRIPTPPHASATRTAAATPSRASPLAVPTPARVTPAPAAYMTMGPGASVDGPWAPFLWMAALAGLMALLTPCVFPMVPITVAWFTRDGRPAGSAVREALAYAAGIIAAFVLLGTTVALLFGATGINRFASSPWLNLALGAAFALFALSMIGVLQIRAPATLASRLSPAVGGPTSTVAAALVFTITSFTCTAPFVGTLLVASAQGGWLRGVAGTAIFAAVFATPFVALAAAPSLLARLPRSGAWMVDLKVVLGVAELCAAVKFFANAGQVLAGGFAARNAVLVIWAVLCAGLAAWFIYSPRTGSGSWRRRAAALAPLAFAFWLLTGAAGRSLGELEAFLPAVADDRWITDDYDAALRLATATGRPVFADFSGYTCTNCRWMETNMFPAPEVARALGGYVRLRMYTDGLGRAAERARVMQRATFHTVALPLYAVIDGTGRPLASFLGMTRDRAEFVDFLERARTR